MFLEKYMIISWFYKYLEQRKAFPKGYVYGLLKEDGRTGQKSSFDLVFYSKFR